MRFFANLPNIPLLASPIGYLPVATVSYAFGIACNHYYAIPFLPLFIGMCLFFVLLIIDIAIIKNPYMRFFLLLLFSFSLGSFLDHRQQNSFQEIQQSLAGTHTIIGTINDLATASKGYLRNMLVVRIDKMDTTLAAHNQLILIYTHSINDLQVGDIIEMKDIKFKETDDKASFKNYLIKQGYAITSFAPNLSYSLMHRPSYSIQRFLHAQRKHLFEHIKQRMNKKNFTLIAKIFFGSTDTSPYYAQQMKQCGNRWGIAHHFARSGLHMAIFALILNNMGRFLPTYFILKQLFILIISIIYYLLSWPSVSFDRAFFTFILYKLGTLNKKQTDAFHLLTCVCMFVLLTNPVQLFFVDFQLSFGLTFALLILNRAHRYTK